MLAVVLVGVACTGVEPPQADGTEGSTADPSSSTAAEATTSPSALDTTDAATSSDPDGSSGEAGSSGDPPMGTPGCGIAAMPGDATVQRDVDGTAREYILVVPPGYDPATPTPLVFAFHGLGSTHELARLYFQVEQAADGDAIFVYPQGLPIASEGGATGWDLGPSGIDVAFYDAMLDELTGTLCIDPDRVFATGHSFGGYMSNALGCFRASTLRAIAPVAGGPPLDACEDDTVAAWLAHGQTDGIVPFFLGELARDSLVQRNGCEATTAPVEPDPCVAHDGCADGMPVVWCAHQETTLSGHMWPRFAGAAIWAFFEGLPPKP